MFTLEQIAALDRIYRRDLARVESNKECGADPATCTPYWASFAECLAAAVQMHDYVGICVGKLWLGIEPDGYTHS